MKCEKCNSEWNSSRSIQVCPFCGASLVHTETKKPEDIICFIVNEYGIDVLRNKKLLLSYFCDYAPFMTKEYKLLKNSCSTDFIAILLSSDASKSSREIAAKKATRLLMEDCFMSDEYANSVVSWITASLKWEPINTNTQQERTGEEETTYVTEKNSSLPLETKDSDCPPQKVLDFISAEKIDTDLVGVKGHQLSELTKMGMPVPQGFIINSNENTLYYEEGNKLSEDLKNEIRSAVQRLEVITGKRYGDKFNPLILSLSVSPSINIPGLIEDVLCIGFNNKVTETFADFIDEEWAWSTYCQFIVGFMDQVLDIPQKRIQEVISEYKTSKTYIRQSFDNYKMLDNSPMSSYKFSKYDYKQLAFNLLKKYKEWLGIEFPQNTYDQLFMAIEATYKNWISPRATVYRKDKKIPFSVGQAICVQQMVFGNLNEDSGVGRFFYPYGTSYPNYHENYYEKTLTLNNSHDFGLEDKSMISSHPPISSKKIIDLLVRNIINRFGKHTKVFYTVENGSKVYINGIEE